MATAEEKMKKFVFMVCFVLAGGLIFAQTAPTKDKVSQAARLLGVPEADLQTWVDSKFISVPTGIPDITAEQLYQEYEASQPRADRAYKDKQIKVTGTVGAIEEEYDANYKKRYALKFKTSTYSSNVYVFFDDSDIEPLFNVAIGQKVSIIGILVKSGTIIYIEHAKIL
jgi:hypothetical protein